MFADGNNHSAKQVYFSPAGSGFTLMELLIVISIMLILMLIAIPNMLNLEEPGQ